jgi:hypothetical protein
MKATSVLAGLILSLGLGLGSASALPAGGAGSPVLPGATDSLVQKVHGCHRSCQLGPAGWHYHVGPRCRRVVCGVFPGGPWIWWCDRGRCGWWHPHHRRWY